MKPCHASPKRSICGEPRSTCCHFGQRTSPGVPWMQSLRRHAADSRSLSGVSKGLSASVGLVTALQRCQDDPSLASTWSLSIVCLTNSLTVAAHLYEGTCRRAACLLPRPQGRIRPSACRLPSSPLAVHWGPVLAPRNRSSSRPIPAPILPHRAGIG